MLRKFLFLGLLLSFFFLIGSMVATWRQEAVSTAGMDKTRTSTVPVRKKMDFYPPVPARLPDLNRGYIFNEARFLADEKDTEKGPAESTVEATIDEVMYIGSVITGKRRIGIIAYTEKNEKQSPVVSRGQGRPVITKQQAENKHAQLAPGETFGGFTVAEVLPDRIVFKKNGRKVEKLLAAGKERKSPPPQLKIGSRAQGQSRRPRVVSPRRVRPARVPAGIRTELRRQSPPSAQQSPATVIHRRPRVIRGDQPSG
jgi:hypothetical protein